MQHSFSLSSTLAAATICALFFAPRMIVYALLLCNRFDESNLLFQPSKLEHNNNVQIHFCQNSGNFIYTEKFL